MASIFRRSNGIYYVVATRKHKRIWRSTGATTLEEALDNAKRLALYQKLNQVLRDDAPWVYMWNPEDIYAIRSNLSGFAPNGVGYFYVKNLSRK